MRHLSAFWHTVAVTLPPLPLMMMAAMPSSVAQARYCLCRAVTWKQSNGCQTMVACRACQGKRLGATIPWGCSRS